jgi:L-asparaginase/Glu-tRNA(Gln) amidotransferase subunit D
MQICFCLRKEFEREAEIDDKYGFIAGGSLSPQKAKILLSVALCHTADRNEIQRIFNEY